MKKFGKFLFGTVSVATVACGAYYLYKNLVNKDSSDDFDEFEDEFEDFDAEDEDTTDQNKKDTREYVSINITSEGSDQGSFEDKVSAADTDSEEKDVAED
ncbi:hypothetical protein [Anaerocolumna sp. MB42-C2]|uniref:hypothetical protein n=1 Tax=Anaerocolumna sp. MB42-C2 TaxID=3070997 RepID=UPI0027E11389|nr:hypothetical protein [Anaerocolumna sp. MB42-C2]WMJ90159.1 hypothetical protein RBU59_11725 [Anaerocolumna sp. MB42-C2]